MAWVRLDDRFFDHPKVVELSQEAKLLYLAALCHANGNRTDGKLTRGALRVIAAKVEAEAEAAAAALVEAGLWEQVGDLLVIHDYHEYQPSLERTLKTSQERAEAGRLGGKASGAARRAISEANEANAKQIGERSLERSFNPVPVPVPVPNAASPSGEARALTTGAGEANGKQVASFASPNGARAFVRQSYSEFDQAYPKPLDFEVCFPLWAEKCGDEATFRAIMAGLDAWINSAAWQEKFPKFVTAGASWLAKEAWKKPPKGGASGGRRPDASVERDTGGDRERVEPAVRAADVARIGDKLERIRTGHPAAAVPEVQGRGVHRSGHATGD